MLTAQEVAEKIAGSGPLRRDGQRFMVRCPAHDDNNPSLGITTGHTQPVLMRCYAGCELDAILAAAGLDIADVTSGDYDVAQERPVRSAKVVRVYRYRDENGDHLYDVLRLDPKGFAQRVPDESQPDGWKYRLDNVRRVPYRLPEALVALSRGEELWIVEGEKDVHRLYQAGLTATCNPQGAGKWTDEMSEVLQGATCTIVADRDPQGQNHARAVRESLMRFGCRARIVEPHISLQGKGADVSDHFEAGYGVDDFVETVPYDGLSNGLALAADVEDYLRQVVAERTWVIDNTLARGEILGVTGFEGHGKSLLLKQIAICTAAGLHAFTFRRQEPKRVLFLDCENTTSDNLDDFRMLRHMARKEADWENRERLFIMETGSIDLFDESTQAWFVERVRAHNPDLLVVGPIYAMVRRDLSNEDAARQLKEAIDQARAVNGCAVVWEHHVPLAQGGAIRDTRPIGSSLLLRWPNFGFGLQPIPETDDYLWKGWRGPRRRTRVWPQRITAGGPGNWPWVETT